MVHKGGSGEGVYYPHSSKLFSRQSKPNGNHYICFRLPFFTVLVKRKIGSFFTLCILNQRKRLERYLSMIKKPWNFKFGILILLCMFHLTCNSFVVMSKASFSLSNERWNEAGFLFLSVFSRYPMHIVRSLNRADIHAWLVPNWGHFFFVYQYSPPIFKIRMT